MCRECLTSKMASPNQPSDMDTKPDGPEPRMCAITCPLCQKRFVLSVVFNTHLLGHINYYYKFAGDDNNHNKPFACTICDFEHEDIFEVNTHIETLHAVKYRIDSLTASRILDDNDREKSQIIRLLGRSDKPANPLHFPFNYWDWEAPTLVPPTSHCLPITFLNNFVSRIFELSKDYTMCPLFYIA